MNGKSIFSLCALCALTLASAAFGRLGGGIHRSSGGHPQSHAPSGHAASFHPAGGGGHPPSHPPSGGSRLPVQKPAKPPSRPGGGGEGIHHPSGSSSALPSLGGGGSGTRRPDFKRPDIKPDHPSGKLPDQGGDFAGFHFDHPGAGGSGTQWKPGDGIRPSRPGQGGSGTQWKPGDGLPPSRPGQGGNGTQWRPGDGLPPSRPGQGGSGTQWRPGDGLPPSRPGQGGSGTQWRPGDGLRPSRPGQGGSGTQWRPDRPDRWNDRDIDFHNKRNDWHNEHVTNINNFQLNRTNNWNNINQHWNESGWASRFGSDEYWNWRHDVLDFRKDRCEEVWDHLDDWHNDFFDNHWWGACWWGPPGGINVSVNTSPWWWWKPFAWAAAGAFFGASVASQPVVYDPGTTVIYEGDTYYVNGQPSGDATTARQQAIALASPPVEQVPVPAPAAEGQPETWLPLAVWALTQQEQGDAVMFFQLSVDKDGLVAGAYKNVMTGDDQPVAGQLDKKTQRLAWHVGDVTTTVYETGFSNLENDVASVFVHFGTGSTQTWLLVRLPSPEMPPGAVKIPEIKKP